MLEADLRPASGSELGRAANAAGAARAQQSRAPGEATRRTGEPAGCGLRPTGPGRLGSAASWTA